MSFDEAVSRRSREIAEAASRKNAALQIEREAARLGKAEFDVHMSDLLAFLSRKGVRPCKAYLYSEDKLLRVKPIFTPVEGYFVTWNPSGYSGFPGRSHFAEAILPSGMLWRTGRGEGPSTFHPFVREDESLWIGATFGSYTFKVRGINGTPTYGVSTGSDPVTYYQMEDVFAAYAERILKNHAQGLDKRPRK